MHDCPHINVIRRTRQLIRERIGNPYFPTQPYEAGQLITAGDQLDELIAEIDSHSKACETRTLFNPRRLTADELFRAGALVDKAGGSFVVNVDGASECPCERLETEEHAVRRTLADCLDREAPMAGYELAKLAGAAMKLHERTKAGRPSEDAPDNARNGLDLALLDLDDLRYLHAVLLKAEGREPAPPGHLMDCNVCGRPRSPSRYRECPVCGPASSS